MNIAADLDDVLAQFMLELVRYYNRCFSTKFSRNDFHSYDLWETWGGDRDRAIKVVYDFYFSKDFEKITPFEFSQQAIKSLVAENDLFIVTSRASDIAKKTTNWVDKYFPNHFKEIIMTNTFCLPGSNLPKKTKAFICDELDIDIIIEDNIQTATECASDHRRVFLLDAPWNQCEQLKEGIKRVRNWSDILLEII